MNKLKQPAKTKIEILSDLNDLFKLQEGNVINSESINKICSMYLFENKERNWKNEDVFFLLRFAITGNPVGAPTGEIGEVLGLKAII